MDGRAWENYRPLKSEAYSVSRMVRNCASIGLCVNYLEKGKIRSMTLLRPGRTVFWKERKMCVLCPSVSFLT